MTGTERGVRASADRAASAPVGRAASAPSPSSTTPASPPASAGRAADAGPSLTERRKAATRMEIARAAAGLFMRNGLRATRAEDIARAAGIAPRTFYRYFASKEESLGPLFAAGVQKWAEAVRDAPAPLAPPEAIRHAIVSTLTPGVGVRPESMDWVRSLLRLAEGSPALLRVWGEACQTAERTLAGVLAARADGAGVLEAGADAAGVLAAGADAAGIAQSAGRQALDSAGSSPSPELRLSAAVASAAVRVAVEAWAAGDDAADGPDGPVALALRNLGTLRDFPWSAAECATT